MPGKNTSAPLKTAWAHFKSIITFLSCFFIKFSLKFSLEQSKTMHSSIGFGKISHLGGLLFSGSLNNLFKFS